MLNTASTNMARVGAADARTPDVRLNTASLMQGALGLAAVEERREQKGGGVHPN